MKRKPSPEKEKFVPEIAPEEVMKNLSLLALSPDGEHHPVGLLSRPSRLREIRPYILEKAISTTKPNIVGFGDSRLSQEANPVELEDIPTDEGLKEAIKLMRETLEDFGGAGMAIAATQVGRQERAAVFSINLPKKSGVEPLNTVMINPSYAGVGKRKPFPMNSCMSCGSGPDSLAGVTMYYDEILATWYDEEGVQQSKTFTGFAAKVVQHEIDHLDGIIFPDRQMEGVPLMSVNEMQHIGAIMDGEEGFLRLITAAELPTEQNSQSMTFLLNHLPQKLVSSQEHKEIIQKIALLKKSRMHHLLTSFLEGLREESSITPEEQRNFLKKIAGDVEGQVLTENAVRRKGPHRTKVRSTHSRQYFMVGNQLVVVEHSSGMTEYGHDEATMTYTVGSHVQ